MGSKRITGPATHSSICFVPSKTTSSMDFKRTNVSSETARDYMERAKRVNMERALQNDHKELITQLMESWYKNHNDCLHLYNEQLEQRLEERRQQHFTHVERQRQTNNELRRQSDLSYALLQGIADFNSRVDGNTAGYLMERLTYALRDHGLRLTDYMSDADETDDENSDIELEIVEE